MVTLATNNVNGMGSEGKEKDCCQKCIVLCRPQKALLHEYHPEIVIWRGEHVDLLATLSQQGAMLHVSWQHELRHL